MKKMSVLLIGMFCMVTLAGCGKSTGNPDNGEAKAVTGDVTVVSREDGSGTRGAFVELLGIGRKDANGEKVDMTTTEASITNNTSVMMTTVAGDSNAIGYISLGSLNDSVKALKIDGAEANADNVKSKEYKVARPFNILTKGELSEVATDFVGYILSTEGQATIEEHGYISIGDSKPYEGKSPKGKIVIAGSSSVSSVMEKLKEAYLKLNANATIEVQTSDSTTGVQSTVDGICDIGMASRELKDSEKEAGVEGRVIAMDGIAVIVNKENQITELSSETIKGIFTGELLSWEEITE